MKSSSVPRGGAGGRGGAFTLIELLVVIAVIALLVSILLPTLRIAKDLARSSVCMGNQRNLTTACAMYQTDFDGANPTAPGGWFINGRDSDTMRTSGDAAVYACQYRWPKIVCKSGHFYSSKAVTASMIRQASCPVYCEKKPVPSWADPDADQENYWPQWAGHGYDIASVPHRPTGAYYESAVYRVSRLGGPAEFLMTEDLHLRQMLEPPYYNANVLPDLGVQPYGTSGTGARLWKYDYYRRVGWSYYWPFPHVGKANASFFDGHVAQITFDTVIAEEYYISLP